MSDDQETGGIKELRDAAERGRKATQELDDMKREMAFLKAGVDTDSKTGQLLFKAYDGDLEVDLIRAEAEELGILRDVKSEASEVPETNDADAQLAQERRSLAADQISPEHQTEDPYEAGHRQFREMVDAGRPVEDAASTFVRTVIEAATSGDSRVLSDR